jgi:hypothetical protein
VRYTWTLLVVDSSRKGGVFSEEVLFRHDGHFIFHTDLIRQTV